MARVAAGAFGFLTLIFSRDRSDTVHPVSLNNSFQAELTNRLKSVGSNAASIFSGSLRDAGIKVGPVFLLHLGSSVQIELSGTGAFHVDHTVYCCLDPCRHIERTCNR
jgi:hypothetical protein